jgi:hypothetical protein
LEWPYYNSNILCTAPIPAPYDGLVWNEYWLRHVLSGQWQDDNGMAIAS